MTSPDALAAGSSCQSELPNAELIMDQLRRILESPGFRNSKRYAAVFRYIIEQTLKGHADQLKERTIGVDVFGRMPDYDTSSDHVVRSAMAEVRKRLGQYYVGANSAAELQIELQPGSYVPQFRPVPVPVEVLPIEAELIVPLETPPPVRSVKIWALGSIGLLLTVLIIAVFVRRVTGKSEALQNFWAPVLSSPGEVLLCIGNLAGGQAAHADASPVDLRLLSMGDFHRLPTETIHVSDAISLANIVNFLGTRNKRWNIADQTKADYGDLRNGPAVLIGLMNNDWTKRLLGKARFKAEKVAPRQVVIRDSRDPQNNKWAMDYTTPLLNVTRDYALIVRVLDPNTDQTVVTAAGISVFGTLAASEFLTDPRSLSELSKIAPGWESKNLEVVLSTEVVRARSGRPHILAVQVW